MVAPGEHIESGVLAKETEESMIKNGKLTDTETIAKPKAKEEAKAKAKAKAKTEAKVRGKKKKEKKNWGKK